MERSVGYVPHEVDERTTLMLAPNMRVSGDPRVEQAVLTGEGLALQRPRQDKVAVAIGGNTSLDNLNEVVKRMRKGEAPTIITTPTQIPDLQFDSYKERFQYLGVSEEPYHVGAHTLPFEGRAMLRLSGGAFITGGNQERGRSQLEEKGLDTELRATHDSGKVVAGTSAGAHMLGEVTSIGREDRGGISTDIIPGAGLVKGVVFDSHLHPRLQRIDRMKEVIETSTEIGKEIVDIGLPESSGIIIDQTGRVETFGRREATVMWQYDGVARDKFSGDLDNVHSLPRVKHNYYSMSVA